MLTTSKELVSVRIGNGNECQMGSFSLIGWFCLVLCGCVWFCLVQYACAIFVGALLDGLRLQECLPAEAISSELALCARARQALRFCFLQKTPLSS